MFGAKTQVKGLNSVHNDQIWKDHVQREMHNARSQLRTCKWKFRKPINVNGKPLKTVTSSATSKNSTAMNTHWYYLNDTFYPQTTTSIVGWRARYNLERYGRHAKGKVKIEDVLGIPPLSILNRAL